MQGWSEAREGTLERRARVEGWQGAPSAGSYGTQPGAEEGGLGGAHQAMLWIEYYSSTKAPSHLCQQFAAGVGLWSWLEPLGLSWLLLAAAGVLGLSVRVTGWRGQGALASQPGRVPPLLHEHLGLYIYISERRERVSMVKRVEYSAGEGVTDWSLRGFGAAKQGDRHAASPCPDFGFHQQQRTTRGDCLLIGTGRLA